MRGSVVVIGTRNKQPYFSLNKDKRTRLIYLGQKRVARAKDLSFDQVGHVARINGQLLELSARELALLEIFMQRAGRMLNKQQLLDHLCQWGEEVSTNAIEVYVHRLRKKLEAGGVRILTVRGLGYCLEKSRYAAA